MHLEGPVVDSLYDVLLLSWHETFTPVLPCLTTPSLYSPSPTSPASIPAGLPYTFNDSNPFLAKIDIIKAAKAARKLLMREGGESMALEAGERSASKGGFASLVTGLVQKGKQDKEEALVAGEKSAPSGDPVDTASTSAVQGESPLHRSLSSR